MPPQAAVGTNAGTTMLIRFGEWRGAIRVGAENRSTVRWGFGVGQKESFTGEGMAMRCGCGSSRSSLGAAPASASLCVGEEHEWLEGLGRQEGQQAERDHDNAD